MFQYLKSLFHQQRRRGDAGLFDASRQTIVGLEGGEKFEVAGDLSLVKSLIAAALSEGDSGRFQELIKSGLARYPDDPFLNLQAGHMHLSLKEPDQALDFYRLALHYDAYSYDACVGIASAFDALGRADDAFNTLRAFLDANPLHIKATIAVADRLYVKGNHEEVVRVLEPLMNGPSVDGGAANLLGLVLGREFGDFQRAEDCLRRALEADPTWLPALTNLGWILLEQGRNAEGEAIIAKALSLSPMDGETRLVRACMNLKQGRFADGWRDYDSRLESRHAIKRPYRFPEWRGEDLSGMTILVYAEQGVGDQIMFASCFNDLRYRAKRVIVECNPKLVKTFRRSFPWAEIQEGVPANTEPAWLDGAGHIDVQIAMGSLPGFFRNNWDDFPRHQGYLFADPARVRYWKELLSNGNGKVNFGLSWRGGSVVTRRHLRTLPAVLLAPLASSGYRWVSLQYDDVTEDLAALRERISLDITHWDHAIADYDETAALVMALDGVLSVCTSIIHLAGALGQKVWILAPTITEWRYLDQGERLPWYPSARVIRQRQMGDWNEPIAEALTAMDSTLGKR